MAKRVRIEPIAQVADIATNGALLSGGSNLKRDSLQDRIFGLFGFEGSTRSG